MYQLKKTLEDIVDYAYPDNPKKEQYKKFFLTMINQNYKSKHGDYHHSTSTIRVFNLYREKRKMTNKGNMILKQIVRIDFKRIIWNFIYAGMQSIGLSVIIFIINGSKSISYEEIVIGSRILFSVLIFMIFFVDIVNGRLLKPNVSVIGNELYGQTAVCIPKPTEEEKQYEVFNKKVMCTHEAGHALLTYLLTPYSFTSYAQLGKGYTSSAAEAFFDKEKIKNQLCIVYGGAAAEEVIFGHFYNGCMGSNDADFEVGVSLLKEYVVMNDPSLSKTYLDQGIQEKMVSLSKEIYDKSKELVMGNRDKLEKIITELETKGKIKREELQVLFE